MNYYNAQSRSGFGLVEVLVVLGLTVMIFAGLFASVQYSLQLIANSSARLSALSLANDRIEYFRSLPYDDVGTVSGIPSGLIPQNSTTTLNGIEFAERVLVEYVDDVADGALTATTTDSNGIPSDYKRIKVEISWTIHDQTNNVSLVSNIVPRSIETTTGGGTVRVNVLDADSSFLSGAEVRLLNETTTTTIDVTRFSDTSGAALFSGAPAASDYQVFVTADGYSIDQTYVATTSNPNPVTAPFAVLESDISTVTFQIGALSNIELSTMASVSEASTTYAFASTSELTSATDATVAGGELELTNTSGSFALSGQAFLQQFNPPTLERWESIVIIGDAPTDTEYRAYVYTGATSTGYTLISDGLLPGNAIGHTDPIIDLTALDPATYPNITVGINLETTNTLVTPEVSEVTAYYRTAEVIEANVGFDIEGSKVIGEELDLTPIPKVSFSTTTDGSGERSLADIEFDSYTITNTSGLTVTRACPNIPLAHAAGATSTLEMVFTSSVTDSLRVYVEAATGEPLPGAIVTVSRTGFSDTGVTDACGQVFFSSGVVAATDYTVTADRTGYNLETLDPFEVSGNTDASFELTEL